MPTSKERILAKTRQLIAQAVDGGTTPEERRTFALKACQLIDEWDLLGSVEPLPTARASSIRDTISSPEVKQAMREATSAAFDLFTQSMVNSALRGAGRAKRPARR